MAELTPRERLQPSLLDRLTDHEPHKTVESRDQRVLSLERLRDCVVRDLAWLLNTENMSSRQRIDGCDDVMKSVVNFGIPCLTGVTSSAADGRRLERMIQEAIYSFEPRLIRDSVVVRMQPVSREMSNNALRFRIEANLWAQPLPLHLFFQTEIDLDTGQAEVTHRLA